MLEQKLIAVVEDEEDILELITVNLKKAGFPVKGFSEPLIFLKYIEKQKPDLIILDLMLPGMDGLEVCKNLKKDERFLAIPVIMVTARTEETDRILGLELGADDYVSKPFSPRELVARVKAVLRRDNLGKTPKPIKIGKILEISLEKFEVFVEGKKIALTTTEFKILELLAAKKGIVFSREKLLDFLWGQEKSVLDRTIDVHVKNLREKLGRAGEFVKNIRGVGYKIEE